MYTLPTVSESYSRQVLTLHTDTFYQKKKENGKLQRIVRVYSFTRSLQGQKEIPDWNPGWSCYGFFGSWFLVQKKKVLQDNSMIEWSSDSFLTLAVVIAIITQYRISDLNILVLLAESGLYLDSLKNGKLQWASRHVPRGCSHLSYHTDFASKIKDQTKFHQRFPVS